MKYIKLFESKKEGWSKEKVKRELFSNCDSEINRLQEKLNKLVVLKENLDADFSELDFFIRANFSELPGFSHYFYDSPGHSSDYVKTKLEVVFNTDETKNEIISVITDFLNDCKELKSISVDKDYDIYDGYSWSSKSGFRYVTYLSSVTKRIGR